MHYTAQTFGKKMKACEGDTFEELSTHIIYTYHDGFWYPPLVQTPSTPEIGSVEPDPIPEPESVEVIGSEAVSQDETPKPKKQRAPRKKKETKE